MSMLKARTALDRDRLLEVAAQVGTPTYVYDGEVLDAGVQRWVDAVEEPAEIFYAVKANSNLAVLARLAGHGVGFEAATPGEMARALRAGIPPSRIILGGVPKSPAAVEEAIRARVGLIVLQADHEIEAAIAAVRQAEGTSKRRVGIRVRPGIRAGAHPSLETGRADAKFGFGPEVVPDVWRKLASAPGLRPVALAVHLGSGLDDLEPYGRALDVLLPLAEQVRDCGAPVTELDLGGGLGVSYDGSGPDLEPTDLVELVSDRLAGTDLVARYEPGRSIAARAGTLITRVFYRRERDGHPALVCDGGFTDFARSALYGAEHRIEPLDGGEEGPATVDVLGPTCESGDVLGRSRRLHGVRPGDLLAVRDVGAYGFVMASNYNSRPRPAEVLADRSGWAIVRAREPLEDLWRGEVASVFPPGG